MPYSRSYGRAPARSSRSRYTGRAARSSNSRRLGSKRSPAGKHAGVQPVGAARYLTKYNRLPMYTRLERQLERAGVQIHQWKQFQAYERFHLQPWGGYATWACVPYKLLQGTVVTSPDTDLDYMPANCDLYDIGRKMLQNVKDQAGTVTYDNWLNESFDGASTMKQTAGDAVGASAASASQFGPSARIRGMHIKKNHVDVTMENMTSIDAFIEEYELVYTAPVQRGAAWTAFTGTISKTTMKPLEGDAYLGGWDAATSTPTTWEVNKSTNNPTLFDTYKQYPKSFQLNPYEGQYFDIRQYGMRMGGCALEAYARCCLNHRLPQTLMRPFDSSYVTDRKSKGTVGYPDAHMLLCNPKNDPMMAWPEGVRQVHGWSLRRIKKAYCLKPGASHRVVLPVNTSFLQDFSAFPRIADKEADLLAKANGWGDLINTVIRDASSLPRNMRFRCFRVYGDMIHSNVAGTDAYGDSDYQTGSVRVQFQVNRSLCARLAVTDRAKEPQPIFAFDDTSVPVANQEAMNDETDAPHTVAIAGDA